MKFHRISPAASVLILAASIGVLADEKNVQQNSEPKPIVVTVKSLGYDPKKLEVHVGDSVVWTNNSRTKHTATSDDEGKTFDTDEIKPGESSKPVKFDKEGEFKYYCKIHGKFMSGVIVVSAKK